MNKRQLHHAAKRLRPIKPWYFLAASGVSGAVSVVALRHNYQTMSHLRSVVFTADEQNGDVEKALFNLRSYVYSHMNTNLSAGPNPIYPPIQLKYRYDRLVAAQQAAQNNSQVYTDAQHYCEQLNSADFSGHNRVPCIEQYVSDHGAKAQAAIPDSLYKFDFISPRWSPDAAGWSLVFSAVFLLVALSLFVFKFVAKLSK